MLNAYSEGKTTSTNIKAKIPSVHFRLEVDVSILTHRKKVEVKKIPKECKVKLKIKFRESLTTIFISAIIQLPLKLFPEIK